MLGFRDLGSQGVEFKNVLGSFGFILGSLRFMLGSLGLFVGWFWVTWSSGALLAAMKRRAALQNLGSLETYSDMK